MEDKIINRIKKLMALAADPAASDGERDNALRMAHATMVKYNIDSAQVQGQATGPTEARGIHKKEFYGRPWAITLAQAIAGLFFCNYMYGRSAKTNWVNHQFVGKDSNADAAMEVAEVLINSIFREGSRRMRAEGENVTWRRSFCTGATFKIMDRIRQLKAESTRGGGTALVVADLYSKERAANQLAVQSLGIKVRQVADRSKKSVHSDALAQGREFGTNLPLAPTKKLS